MNDVGSGIPLSPLDCTPGQTTSRVVGYHSSLTTHIVGQRQVWNNIIALEKHKRLNDFARGMSSWPYDSANVWTMSGVACHNRPLTTQTNERNWPWNFVIAL